MLNTNAHRSLSILTQRGEKTSQKVQVRQVFLLKCIVRHISDSQIDYTDRGKPTNHLHSLYRMDKTGTCMNRRSRNNPHEQCKNPATHGAYCGLHYKNPHTWIPSDLSHEPQGRAIAAWFRLHYCLYMIRIHGIAYWDKSILTNNCDFFSTEPFTDIDNIMFFSYKDSDNHVYGFDIRSIHTIVHRARMAGDIPVNPYNRNPIPHHVLRNINNLVKLLHKRSLPTEWEPLEPSTPEQKWNMSIVDLFHKIDELHYYSSPDWFIHLDISGHRRFYTELHAIWTHRAGLSIMQKNTIVPQFSSKLFQHPPWAIVNLSLESLQKITSNTIRLLISSAEDKNDRILGAMYVVSALTLVHKDAQQAYPWLYESVGTPFPELLYADERRYGIESILGLGWLQELLSLPMNVPPLLYPDE
jgi:hypothetical protein